MITNENRRKVLLAISGLLVGATCIGWTQQAGWLAASASKPAPRKVVEKAAVEPKPQIIIQKIIERVIVPASTGRPDPVSPVVNNPVPYATARVPKRHFIPPPDPSSYPAERAVALEMQQQERLRNELKKTPLCEAVRLAGLLDGKAIFTLPIEIAKAKHLDPSFTLGVGQKYSDLTLESIHDSSVTIRDGTKVSTKHLSPIN